MTPIRWAIFALICVAAIVGLIIFTEGDKVDVSQIDSSKVQADDNVFGNREAKVVLVEYGDFQCPSCKGAYPQLKTLKETFKDDMAFVFRNFPLTTIHPNALAAASAAEAAAKQDKFWEMHDLLYQNQSSWQGASGDNRGQLFASYASQIGLNVDQFKTDMASEEVSKKIATDRALGTKDGADSTPSIYLNGQKVAGDVVSDAVQGNGDKLKALIEAAINS